MTRNRLIVIVLVAVVALGAGLLLGRGSAEPEPDLSRQGAVSASTDEIILPGLWLGRSYRQAVPMLSLTRMPGQRMNGPFYALIAPARELVAIEPYSRRRPIGWKEVKTPVGQALVNPEGNTAWIEDPQGRPLRIYSYVGQVRDVLSALEVRPD